MSIYTVQRHSVNSSVTFVTIIIIIFVYFVILSFCYCLLYVYCLPGSTLVVFM